MLILLLVAFLLATVTDIMDDRITQRGIDKVVAVEGNSYIDKIFHTVKPTYHQRLLVNFAIIFGVALIGLIPILTIGAATAEVVIAVKHYLGYRAWKKLGVN